MTPRAAPPRRDSETRARRSRRGRPATARAARSGNRSPCPEPCRTRPGRAARRSGGSPAPPQPPGPAAPATRRGGASYVIRATRLRRFQLWRRRAKRYQPRDPCCQSLPPAHLTELDSRRPNLVRQHRRRGFVMMRPSPTRASRSSSSVAGLRPRPRQLTTAGTARGRNACVEINQ